MFGQYIPLGGWKNNSDMGKQYTYKTMKTQELKDTRTQEIKSLDDTAQYILSRHMLQQFNQIKSVDSAVSIHCFSSGASLTYFQSSTSYYKLPSSHRAANGGNGSTESLCFDLHL